MEECDEEGFVNNEIEVTSKRATIYDMKYLMDDGLALIENKKPIDFVPRYINTLKYALKYPPTNPGSNYQLSPLRPSRRTNTNRRSRYAQKSSRYPSLKKNARPSVQSISNRRHSHWCIVGPAWRSCRMHGSSSLILQRTTSI